MPTAPSPSRPLAAMLGRYRRSSFLRGVGILMGGTVLAQLISLLALPILSRLYAPETFALLALVMTAASLTGPVSTGLYEQAIANPRTIGRARLLASIAFWLTSATTLLVILVLALLHHTTTLWNAQLSALELALPFALWFGSLQNITNYWLLRSGKHGLQVGIKIIHAIINAVVAILLGLVHLRFGLLYGFMVGMTLAGIWGLYWAHRYGFRFARFPMRRYVLPALHHYREFPLFGSIPATLNNLAMQLPLLLITAHYSLETVGHFSMTRNLLMGGLVLVSVCIGQVLLKHLSQRIHARQPLWPFFSRVMLATGAVGLLGGASLYIFGAQLFTLYLGPRWADSGTILPILAISSPLVLMGCSLAPALVAMRRIRIMARWQLFYLLASGMLYFFIDVPFLTFVWRVVAMESIAYLIYIPLIVWQVKSYDRR